MLIHYMVKRICLVAAIALIVPFGMARGTPQTANSTPYLNPASVTYLLPSQIKWGPVNKYGEMSAPLTGDPSKPGLYAELVRWTPRNHFSPPHFHPNDRFIYVLSGIWWVGTNTKGDPADTVAMPVGTFVTHFGKEIHYDGAKDEECEFIVFGEGPATATPAKK
jgi:hypothetical protein